MAFIIRRATKKDFAAVFKLIEEFAGFEKLSSEIKITAEAFECSGVSEDYKCLVAEKDNSVVGYALYYDCYSSFQGPKLHLEDLYLQPHLRKQGFGKRLYNAICKEAFTTCIALRYYVLDWNEGAKSLYKRLGADDRTQLNEMHIYRFDKDAMTNMCQLTLPEVCIRKTTEVDASTIHGLTEDFLHYLSADAKHQRSLDDFTEDIYGKDSKRSVLVAETDGKAVGYCMVYPTFSTFQGKMLHLEELYVTNDCRRKGIGKALMATVAKTFMECSYCRAQLVVYDYDKQAVNFYKALGAKDLTAEQGWLYYSHKKVNWKEDAE